MIIIINHRKIVRRDSFINEKTREGSFHVRFPSLTWMSNGGCHTARFGVFLRCHNLEGLEIT
jgi:hypothetical protein